MSIENLNLAKDSLGGLTLQLCNALLQLKNHQEVDIFLLDLCTPSEVKSMEERLEVARLLSDNFLSYREIHEVTKVSIATITRVARFLLHEGYNGYKTVLKSLNEAGLLPTQNSESGSLNLHKQLADAFLQLRSPEEVLAFLKDLCTPAEIKAMEERLQVANLLRVGFLSYREIHDLIKVSIATITRVARFLFHEKNNGYKLILNRMAEKGLLTPSGVEDKKAAC